MGEQKDRNDGEEKEESKDGTQSERKHGRHLVRVCEYGCTRTCTLYVWDGFGASKKDKEYEEEDEAGKKGEERRGDRERERERKRRGDATRLSPISILIELNATSYLMPETRQKLQLNDDAISFYLPVHSSWLPDRSSPR